MIEKIQKEIVTSMKAKDAKRTTVLRLLMNNLKNKEKDKQSVLTEQEIVSVLTSALKQRRDSIDQFLKGNRQDLVDQEQYEIGVIEEFLPKSMDKGDVNIVVLRAVAALQGTLGRTLTQKDMGAVMKASQAIVALSGKRADGKMLSNAVKSLLQ